MQRRVLQPSTRATNPPVGAKLALQSSSPVQTTKTKPTEPEDCLDSMSFVESGAEDSQHVGQPEKVQPPAKCTKRKRLATVANDSDVKPKATKTVIRTMTLQDHDDLHDELEPVLEPEIGISKEMQKLLETFGVDAKKSLMIKQKRLEHYTANCLKSGSHKVEEVWQAQQAQRQKMQNEFQTQATAIFTQWETDIERTKENEEKLQNQLRQQQKLFQQARIVQSQRMSALKDLCASYAKNLEEVEKTHLAQQTSTQAEMKREMALLQKKILMECQQQEMANVRKSLQSLFH